MDQKHAFAHGDGGLDDALLEHLALRHLNAHHNKAARNADTYINGNNQTLGLAVRVSQDQPGLIDPAELTSVLNRYRQ